MRNLVAILLLACSYAAAGPVDVLTANYDNERTNANPNEGILNTNNVNSTQFGKLFSFAVDGQVYAQPLYVHGVPVSGKGTLNVLYVATMHNTVYAFDADASTATAPLWQVNLGTSVDPASIVDPVIGTFDDIQHEIGILSTPVIDRDGGTIYVVAETAANAKTAFYLHALDLATGSEKLNGPVEIQGTVPGKGWGGSSDPHTGQLPFLPAEHIQRPGLLLANGSVYVAFGSHGDFVPWHGWLMAYKATDLQQQTAVFNTTPDDAGAAIWQSGRGLAADTTGQIYLATGNGSYDGTKAWGETVLQLDPTLGVTDWFTPSEYTQWTDEDADLGSNGPILIPGTNLVIAGGKSGLVALIDRTNMGHEMANDTQAPQTFQAVPSGKFAIYNAALWDRPDGPVFYIWGYQDVLRAFRLENGKFNTTAFATNSTAKTTYPFSGMTVSSNGFVPGSGILWMTSQIGGFPSPGTLRAFDASDVSRELWNSDQQGGRDTLGNFTKFANPTVANARVYAPTDSHEVVVYGLLPVPGITAVVNAASFSASTVAPGELITIFGIGIGPAVPQSLTLDGHGNVTTSLGGVTVQFDGAPAPLLYASSGQINAVVPFSLAGRTSTVLQVSAPGGKVYSVGLPVSTAAPAIFTIGAAGSGQGAILNSDYTVNSPAHPAPRGSAISIYSTGSGALKPPVADGILVPLTDPPTAAGQAIVSIGGQAAQVGYHGAAPGLVAGVVQINVQVPENVAPGPAVPVNLTVDGTAGLNTVTVAIQ